MARLITAAGDDQLQATAPTSNVPATLACWFYPVGDVFHALVSLMATSGSNDHRLTLNAEDSANGQRVTAQTRNTGNAIATSSGTWTLNAWNHGVAVFASATSRAVYLNGGSKGTNANNRVVNNAADLVVGGIGSSSGWDGRIAEVAVWNVALSDAEVAALAARVPAWKVRPGSLVAYYPLLRDLLPEPSYGSAHNSLDVITNTPAMAAHAPVGHPLLAEQWAPYVVAALPAAASPRLLASLGVGS